MNDAEKSAFLRAMAATNTFMARFVVADDDTQAEMLEALEALCADKTAIWSPVAGNDVGDFSQVNVTVPAAAVLPEPADDTDTDAIETDDADIDDVTDGAGDAPAPAGGFLFGADPYAEPVDADLDAQIDAIDLDEEVELRPVGAALRLVKADDSAWTDADQALLAQILPGKLAVIPGEWTTGDMTVDGNAVVVALHTEIEADGTVGPGAGQLSITAPGLSVTGWLVSDDTLDGVEAGDIDGLVEACEAFVAEAEAAAYAEQYGEDAALANAVDNAIIGDADVATTRLVLFSLPVGGGIIDEGLIPLVEDAALTQLRNDYTNGQGAAATKAFADATFTLASSELNTATGLVTSRYDVTGDGAVAYMSLMARGGQAAADVLPVDGVGDVAYALIADVGVQENMLAEMAYSYLETIRARLA